MYREKRKCILKNHVYVQILIYNISNFIKEFNFLEALKRKTGNVHFCEFSVTVSVP